MKKRKLRENVFRVIFQYEFNRNEAPERVAEDYIAGLDEEVPEEKEAIDAKDIKLQETDSCIDVQIDYALEVNYEHLADCTIKMKIASKEKGEFSLA